MATLDAFANWKPRCY